MISILICEADSEKIQNCLRFVLLITAREIISRLISVTSDICIYNLLQPIF
jgi:hypothetical protein